MIDDYKASCTEPQVVVNVIQKYAEQRGRMRLMPGAKPQDEQYIRGLLLSTGEDFVYGVESILGRTIVIDVDDTKSKKSAYACWKKRDQYAAFLPHLIRLVISRPAWKKDFRAFVERAAEMFQRQTGSMPNGVRIAANWALNAWGFSRFLDALGHLGVLDKAGVEAMHRQYQRIVAGHLRDQRKSITSESPAMIMFGVLGEKLTRGSVYIEGLGQRQGNRGTLVGKVKLGIVYLFPNATMGLLVSHFRQLGQRIPFSPKTLRDALAKEGLIEKDHDRWTTQVRVTGGNRQQGWGFSRKLFEEKCGLEAAESSGHTLKSKLQTIPQATKGTGVRREKRNGRKKSNAGRGQSVRNTPRMLHS